MVMRKSLERKKSTNTHSSNTNTVSAGQLSQPKKHQSSKIGVSSSSNTILNKKLMHKWPTGYWRSCLELTMIFSYLFQPINYTYSNKYNQYICLFCLAITSFLDPFILKVNRQRSVPHLHYYMLYLWAGNYFLLLFVFEKSFVLFVLCYHWGRLQVAYFLVSIIEYWDMIANRFIVNFRQILPQVDTPSQSN